MSSFPDRSAISFGLINIPVELHVATPKAKAFSQSLLQSEEAIGEQPGDKKDDLVGENETRRKYLEAIAELEGTKNSEKGDQETEEPQIEIQHFTDLKTISPIYYHHSYFAVSEKGGEKAFTLLRLAMKDTNKVAIGRTKVGAKQVMLVLIPTTAVILLVTMHFFHELNEIPKEIAQPLVHNEELAMAKDIIFTMNEPFCPTGYRADCPQSRISEQKKSGGVAGDIAFNAKNAKEKVFDIIEDLRKTLRKLNDDKYSQSRKAAG